MPDYLTNDIDNNRWRFRNPDNWDIDFTVNALYPRIEQTPGQEQRAYLRRLIEGDFQIRFRIGFFDYGDQTGNVTISLVEDVGGGGDDGTAVGTVTYKSIGSQFRFSTSWGTVITDSTSGFYDVRVIRVGSNINTYHKFNGVGAWILEPSTLNSLENILLKSTKPKSSYISLPLGILLPYLNPSTLDQLITRGTDSHISS